MKKNSGIFLPILLAIFIGIGMTLFAQDAPNRKIFEELKTEMQNYKDNNVFPAMAQWKEKLDKAMSAEDLATLNTLRQKASELRKIRMEEMKAKREEMPAKREEMRNNKEKMSRAEIKAMMKEMKEERKESQEEMKAIGEQVKPLAEKYNEVLTSITAEAKDKSEEWKNGMKKIHESWKAKYESELDNMKNAGRRGKRDFKRERKGMKREMKNEFDLNSDRAVIKFMLWDGEKLDEMPRHMPGGPMMRPDDAPEHSFMNSVEETSAFANNVMNYPNPFEEKTNIFFTLQSGEDVNITLIDNTGNTVGTIFSGKLEAGEHSIEFNAGSSDFKDITSGTYIYRIKAGNSIKAGKMMLSR